MVQVTGLKLNPELLRSLREPNGTNERRNRNNSSLTYRIVSRPAAISPARALD